MKDLAGVKSHHEWEVEQLRSDRQFAVGYAKVAVESLHNPEERGASLLMLRALAEAYGGVSEVAAQAGISRESLYRSLSPKGNPTLKTLVAVLNAVGLRLSVIDAPKPAASKAKSPKRRAA
jgi:probable addiction module antidote protein